MVGTARRAPLPTLLPYFPRFAFFLPDFGLRLPALPAPPAMMACRCGSVAPQIGSRSKLSSSAALSSDVADTVDIQWLEGLGHEHRAGPRGASSGVRKFHVGVDGDRRGGSGLDAA